MITVDIVTPTRRLVEGAHATSVKLPALKGEIEVLPGHTELISLLTTGVLTIAREGKDRKFFLSHGFVEVRKDKVLVLAETVEESKEIDKERARRAQLKAQEVLNSVLPEGQFKKYQLKLQRALIRQQIAH